MIVVQIVIALIASILGQSMVLVWIMIGTLQFVHMTPLLRIFTPSCFVRFCLAFQLTNANIEWLSSLLLRGLFTIEDFPLTDDYIYQRMDIFSTSFLYNSADALGLWVILIMLIPVLFFLKFLFHR